MLMIQVWNRVLLKLSFNTCLCPPCGRPVPEHLNTRFRFVLELFFELCVFNSVPLEEAPQVNTIGSVGSLAFGSPHGDCSSRLIFCRMVKNLLKSTEIEENREILKNRQNRRFWSKSTILTKIDKSLRNRPKSCFFWCAPKDLRIPGPFSKCA